MPTIAEIRKKYPQYEDMSDRQLADSLYRKFYSDMPRAEFDAKIGLSPLWPPVTPEWAKAFDTQNTGRTEPTATQEELTSDIRAADNAVRAMASGATFGMADELAALGRTATGQGTYAQNVAEERKRDEAIPSLVRIPGEIAGGVMTGTGLARGGLSLLNAARPTLGSMVARGAGEGALYGAAHGFGRGEGLQNRLEEAAYGATLGGATGAAMGGVGAKMARSGMRR